MSNSQDVGDMAAMCYNTRCQTMKGEPKMKNGGLEYPSQSKYRCRQFQIGTAWCSWQLMWDCAREKYVCWRCVDDSYNDEALKRLEKSVWVPCPEMTAEQVSKVAEIFEVMGTKTENRRPILDLLMKDRWHKAAEVLCEKLAKADWEKYGEGKCA